MKDWTDKVVIGRSLIKKHLSGSFQHWRFSVISLLFQSNYVRDVSVTPPHCTLFPLKIKVPWLASHRPRIHAYSSKERPLKLAVTIEKVMQRTKIFKQQLTPSVFC
jgi:hypothetical protein